MNIYCTQARARAREIIYLIKCYIYVIYYWNLFYLIKYFYNKYFLETNIDLIDPHLIKAELISIDKEKY